MCSVKNIKLQSTERVLFASLATVESFILPSREALKKYCFVKQYYKRLKFCFGVVELEIKYTSKGYNNLVEIRHIIPTLNMVLCKICGLKTL